MIAKWIIVGWLAFGALLTIAYIGKPRKPLTSNAAAVTVAIIAAEITAIILWWHA